MITIQRTTHTIDASGIVLGQLAGQVAILLRGKNKPNYAPNIDGGDFVVVKNFKNVKLPVIKWSLKPIIITLAIWVA